MHNTKRDVKHDIVTFDDLNSEAPNTPITYCCILINVFSQMGRVQIVNGFTVPSSAGYIVIYFPTKCQVVSSQGLVTLNNTNGDRAYHLNS